MEAHFACYNAGEFYALHRDNPQGKNGRMISAVYYLHDDWQDNWGGELHLQDKMINGILSSLSQTVLPSSKVI